MPAKRVIKLMVISAAIAALIACSPAAVENPVPDQIKNLAMGASMASVKEMLNGSGGVVTGVSQDKRGPEITWTPTANPYYQTIDFDFTEKDRLYIVRYNLKEAPREEYHRVKKAFFDLYKFDRENPGRLKLRGNDTLVYDRPANSNTYLFEITDQKTGSKSIEIFERSMSAQDKPQKQSEEAIQESGGQPKTAPETDKGPDNAPDKEPNKGPDKGNQSESK
jgi:hypothetical protein